MGHIVIAVAAAFMSDTGKCCFYGNRKAFIRLAVLKEETKVQDIAE